jgi:hypothetical protein
VAGFGNHGMPGSDPSWLYNRGTGGLRRNRPANPQFSSSFILGIGTNKILYSLFGKMVL